MGGVQAQSTRVAAVAILESNRSMIGRLSRRHPERPATRIGPCRRKVLGVGIALSERQTHLADGDPRSQADLQQLHPDGRALRPREIRVRQAQQAEGHASVHS